MVNGTAFIYTYLDRNTDIKRNIYRNIINITSLAKHIQKENPGLDLSATGIITAIRRYVEHNEFEERQNSVDKILESTKLEMSFGNIVLHINKTEHSLSSLTELFKKLNLIGEDSVNLVMDKSSFALIFDNENYDLIRKQFTDDKILTEIKDVGQIVLKLDAVVQETPNVFATILSEIGINNINLIDAITKREKFMIFVKENDLMKACNILYKFTKDARKAKNISKIIA